MDLVREEEKEKTGEDSPEISWSSDEAKEEENEDRQSVEVCSEKKGCRNREGSSEKHTRQNGARDD